MGASSKKVTVGYRIYLGVHMILGHGPFDAITKIEVDNKEAWSGENTGGTISIDAPDLFGGEEREGGIVGNIDVEMGTPSQTPNSYLQSRLGVIPAFRGVVGLVLNQVYIGLNPYMKSWSVWARRILKRSDGSEQWYAAKAQIGQDMNPAHIIRECLTDSNWGMGYGPGDIDDDSFTAAADKLFDEGMGISLLWDRSMSIDEFIGTIREHIDAALYVDRGTGRFVLKLIRDDYNVGGLITIGPSDIKRITDVKRRTVAELVNSVTVIFWDGQSGAKNSVTAQDTALINSMGVTIGTTQQYPGFTVGSLASRAATRDLRALSSPLSSCVLYVTRKGSDLNIGDVFVLNAPRQELESVVMRVSNVELGTLESNLVRLDCVEDVFSIGDVIYAPPAGTQWSLPSNEPADCPLRYAFEAPYWELVQRMGEGSAESMDEDAAFGLAAGVRPTSDAQNAKLYRLRSGAYEEAGTIDFCPTATLAAGIDETDTIISIEDGVDLEAVRLGSYAIVVGTGEAIRIDAISSASLTVGRGCLDTVPRPQPLGSRVWFVDDFAETDGTEYATSETVSYKILPTTARGTLNEGAATAVATPPFGQRQARPYPPARLQLNSSDYPDTIPATGDLVVTWAHRDRLQQTVDIVDTSGSNIGPEPGTTYTAELRTAGGTLISSETGITGSTHTFTELDMGANYGDLRVLLWSVRDGLDSYQKHDYTFERLSP